MGVRGVLTVKELSAERGEAKMRVVLGRDEGRAVLSVVYKMYSSFKERGMKFLTLSFSHLLPLSLRIVVRGPVFIGTLDAIFNLLQL